MRDYSVTGATTDTLFTERQRFRQIWLWALLLIGPAVLTTAVVSQLILGIPFGDNPAPDIVLVILFLLFGIGLPLLFRIITLSTEVTRSEIVVRFRPLYTRRIPISDIRSVSARHYRPIREYGGWGVRWSPTKGMAYNVSGNDGVQLECTDGKRILIGSRRTAELEVAIRDAMTGR